MVFVREDIPTEQIPNVILDIGGIFGELTFRK